MCLILKTLSRVRRIKECIGIRDQILTHANHPLAQEWGYVPLELQIIAKIINIQIININI